MAIVVLGFDFRVHLHEPNYPPLRRHVVVGPIPQVLTSRRVPSTRQEPSSGGTLPRRVPSSSGPSSA
jgi:hypothetical protein